MKKENALQRINSHEKLCRIMQKQTEKLLVDVEELKDKVRANKNGGTH